MEDVESAYDALVRRCDELYHLVTSTGCSSQEGIRAVIVEIRRTLCDVTPEMVSALASDLWPEDWETGNHEQKRLGLDVIPPICEAEVAVGKWLRVIDASPITQAPGRHIAPSFPPETEDQNGNATP